MCCWWRRSIAKKFFCTHSTCMAGGNTKVHIYAQGLGGPKVGIELPTLRTEDYTW